LHFQYAVLQVAKPGSHVIDDEIDERARGERQSLPAAFRWTGAGRCSWQTTLETTCGA
jgi:hypothetical protein